MSIITSQISRYWIGVVSASHVNLAIEGEFAQLCHGKASPLRQMSPGDWMIYLFTSHRHVQRKATPSIYSHWSGYG